jgi:hypothetical protein
MPEDLIERLAHILIDEINGPITRQKVIERRRFIKKASKRNPFEDAKLAPVEQGQPDDNPEQKNDQPERLESDEKTSIVLIDLRSRSDVVNISKDYAPGSEPACLKAGDKLSLDAFVLIVMRLVDAYAVNGKLPFWGKGRFDRIFLFKQATSTEVTDEIVIAIAAKDEHHIFDGLLFAHHESDPIKLCQKLLSDVPGARLHLFATDETPGWDAVIGDDNWSIK